MADLENKELAKALTDIRKQFGSGSIMQLGEKFAEDVQGISVGALSLDLALGGRGLPRGRIIEIFGPEASGKTTITLHAIANAQRAGGVAAFIDTEHALDPGWAKRIGVNLENLLVSQPSCAEDALRIAEMLVKSNAVDIVVLDSVAALVPKAELDGEIGDAHVGLQARLMSQALRILNPLIAKTRTCMVFINQLRAKIGAMLGPGETTAGGNALKYYASVRIDIRRIQQLRGAAGEDAIGSRVKVKVVKNKVAPPFRGTELDLMHDQGISWEGDLIDMAEEDGVIEKSGAWYTLGTQRFQGREAVRTYLRENPAAVAELRAIVLEKRGVNLSNEPSNPATASKPAESSAKAEPTAKRGRAVRAEPKSED